MSFNGSAIVAGALCAAVSSTASASLLQLNYSFQATGTLNGVAFTNAATTITAIVDTANRFSVGGVYDGYGIANTSTQFSVAGVGSGAITTGMVSTSFIVDEFGDPLPLTVGLALASDPSNSFWSFEGSQPSWNMLGALSQASVASNGGNFVKPALSTTVGTLQFGPGNSISGGTFSATAVPAPGAIALVGLAGLAGSRRRRA